MKKIAPLFLLLFSTLVYSQDVPRLQLTDEVTLVGLEIDQILAPKTGLAFSPESLAVELTKYPLVVVGEQHTSHEYHQIQLRVIQNMHHLGSEVVIGLEMFPFGLQDVLDQWTQGELTESEFLEKSDWYNTWGYPWSYYREIFMFAKENNLAMVAANAPASLLRIARKKGVKALEEEDQKHFPRLVETSSEAHYEVFRAYLPDETVLHSGMTQEQWRDMYTAQCWWDAVMAHHARLALKDHPRATVVMLAGTGHAAHGMGITRQFAAQGGALGVNVMPAEVSLDKGSVKIADSYGDYLWGVPEDLFYRVPDPGMMSRLGDMGREVILVDEESPAGRAGLLEGDLLMRVNGKIIDQDFAWGAWKATLKWADQLTFLVQRDEEKLEVTLYLNRMFSAAETETSSDQTQPGNQSQPGGQSQPSGQSQPGTQTQSSGQTQPMK